MCVYVFIRQGSLGCNKLKKCGASFAKIGYILEMLMEFTEHIAVSFTKDALNF
jgi:hypothetical protein